MSTEPGFFESGEDVELEPRSSPELVGAGAGALDLEQEVVFEDGSRDVFLRRISVRRCFCPRLKFSLANSHLSGTIFRKPCSFNQLKINYTRIINNFSQLHLPLLVV